MATVTKADSGYCEDDGPDSLKTFLEERLCALENRISAENQRIQSTLDTLTARVSDIEEKLSDTKNTIKNKRANQRQKIKRSAAICQSTENPDSSDSSFSIKLDELPDACAQVYKDVLVEQHELLISELNLTNTTVLDFLQAKDSLTASDVESIKSEQTKKDQNRSLLLMLEPKGHDVFVNFLDSLQDEYCYLRDSMKRSLSVKCKDRNNDSITCTVCKIIDNVNPKDIIDRLYSQGVISCKEMKNIHQCGNTLRGWEQLKPYLNSKQTIEILVDALQVKFRYLSEELWRVKEAGKFVCFCKYLTKRRRQEQQTDDLQRMQISESVDDSPRKTLANLYTNSFNSRFAQKGFRDKFNRQAFRKKNT